MTLLRENLRHFISRHYTIFKKRILFTFRKPYKGTVPVLILGCGRSGTTMMVNIFKRDDRIEALRENDPKVSQNFMLVHEKLDLCIDNCKAPLLILKPKLNSFEASDLLKRYNQAKIIWMLREYRDVIGSSIEKARARERKFGTPPPSELKNLVVHKKGDTWLTRGIPNETLAKISTLDSSDFTFSDWTALVWWGLNRMIILDKLYEHNRFLLLQYENVVNNPEVVLRHVYEYLGLQYKPGAGKYVHARSIGEGTNVRLHPLVEALCSALYEELKQFSS